MIALSIMFIDDVFAEHTSESLFFVTLTNAAERGQAAASLGEPVIYLAT